MSYHVPSHNMLKWIILIQNLLYNYLEWHIYITIFSLVATSWISSITTFSFVATFWISCFKNFCCMHILKFLYFLYWKLPTFSFSNFFDNTHGISFHFYLYNVRLKTHFLMKKFEKTFFVFCLLQFCCHNYNSKYR